MHSKTKKGNKKKVEGIEPVTNMKIGIVLLVFLLFLVFFVSSCWFSSFSPIPLFSAGTQWVQ